MKGYQRNDDFADRRKHLADMSDEALKAYFWEKVGQIVDPLLNLAHENTSPSIERSVLLRMGFSSIEAEALVDKAVDHGLMGFGVGHVVLRAARENGLDIRAAGLRLIDGELWQEIARLLKEANHA